jgi:putative acetyltransferase
MEFNIRPVEAEDARGLNALRRIPGVCENIMALPSERLKPTEDFIGGLNENTHILVAVKKDETDGETVIGTITLAVNPHPRARHIGEIGLMVHTDYQGQGVGKALLAVMVDLADNWLMMERLQLFVFVDNERAIGLYKKLGFEVEGTQRKSAIRDGEYIDSYMTGRLRSKSRRE